MTALRILVGCETSGVVRRAFAARWHDVWSCDLLPAEDARPIDGFPLYLITNFGRVISFHRRNPEFRTQARDPKGYCCVVLRHEGLSRSARVHRLVAETFIANPDSLPCVRHLDGNPRNNSVSNLAWGTHLQNEDDKRGHGTWNARRTGKLSASDRQTIRELYAQAWSQKSLSDRFGVSRPTITRLLNGTTWAELSEVAV